MAAKSATGFTPGSEVTVSRPRTTLRELLEQAAIKRGSKDDPASSSAMARSAVAAGHKVVHTTLSAIRSGSYPAKPRRQTLEAIAWLANVSPGVAFEAAGLNEPSVRLSTRITDDLDELSPEHQDVVLRVARALLKAQKLGTYSDQVNEDHERVASSGVSVASLKDLGLSGDELSNIGLNETRPEEG